MAALPDLRELNELILKSTAPKSEPESPILSSASSSRSVEGSVEDSGPPTPVNGPPQNYDIVTTGIYRSSYPRSSNFDHLNTLGLKTILTLVSGPHPAEFTAFLQQHEIVHHEIPLPAHKAESDAIPLEQMQQVLDLLLNPDSYPILIHCNKGKHRTGCAIACYRLCSGQPLDEVVDEYRYYAGVKARRLDEVYIRAFTPSTKYHRCALSRSAPVKQAYPTPPASDRSVSLN